MGEWPLTTDRFVDWNPNILRKNDCINSFYYLQGVPRDNSIWPICWLIIFRETRPEAAPYEPTCPVFLTLWLWCPANHGWTPTTGTWNLEPTKYDQNKILSWLHQNMPLKTVVQCTNAPKLWDNQVRKWTRKRITHSQYASCCTESLNGAILRIGNHNGFINHLPI